MLEIKNIVNRDITGIPKEEYWIQMQLQMEVCNLNECDFLETRFKEYENEDDFINDSYNHDDQLFHLTSNNELKGSIIYFIKENKPYYKYSPIYATKNQYYHWFDKTMEENSSLTWMKTIYWKLDEYSCVLVLRNKYWFNHAIHVIENIWNIIEKERINGYDHRAPRKKAKKEEDNTINHDYLKVFKINTVSSIAHDEDDISNYENISFEDNTLLEKSIHTEHENIEQNNINSISNEKENNKRKIITIKPPSNCLIKIENLQLNL